MYVLTYNAVTTIVASCYPYTHCLQPCNIFLVFVTLMVWFGCGCRGFEDLPSSQYLKLDLRGVGHCRRASHDVNESVILGVWFPRDSGTCNVPRLPCVYLVG